MSAFLMLIFIASFLFFIKVSVSTTDKILEAAERP